MPSHLANTVPCGAGLRRKSLIERQAVRVRRSHRAQECGRAIRAHASEEDADETAGLPPDADWREFRARLVVTTMREQEETEAQGAAAWVPRLAKDNQKLLAEQNPELAREPVWVHPTGAPEVGGLLVATPGASARLGEFSWQTVVLLIRHDEMGSIGLVLNRPMGLNIGESRNDPGGLPLDVDGLTPSQRRAFADNRVYCGGLRGQQAMHFLHGHGDLEGSLEIVPGVYIGGLSAAAQDVVDGKKRASDFRFICGMMSWDVGQLNAEVEAGCWITAACSRPLIIKQCLTLPTPLWREVLGLMGGEYAQIAEGEL
ncbi:unnamed protein product [Pedinophyceae sp. YPF-701]|nr:unnamed protein product [Pedinophyceae sp. YPF-701]